MSKQNESIGKWLKEIREVATRALSPNADIKALNCYLNASGKNLAYLRFQESLKPKARSSKKTK